MLLLSTNEQHMVLQVIAAFHKPVDDISSDTISLSKLIRFSEAIS
jgi:hypothetical protein